MLIGTLTFVLLVPGASIDVPGAVFKRDAFFIARDLILSLTEAPLSILVLVLGVSRTSVIPVEKLHALLFLTQSVEELIPLSRVHAMNESIAKVILVSPSYCIN